MTNDQNKSDSLPQVNIPHGDIHGGSMLKTPAEKPKPAEPPPKK